MSDINGNLAGTVMVDEIRTLICQIVSLGDDVARRWNLGNSKAARFSIARN
jgi:hypothetical protein